MPYTPHMQKHYENKTIGEFLDALAARTATLGGGSAAALLSGMGASLGIMACRFTTGEKFKAHAAEMETAVSGLLNLRSQIVPLIDADAAAFDAVSAALAMPKTSDEEKTKRKQALHQSLRGAMEVPRRTMELSFRCLQILQRHAPELNANLASDLASAALCLGSAIEAAWLNVLINAAALKEDAEAMQIKAEAEKVRMAAGELTSSILNAVNAVIK